MEMMDVKRMVDVRKKDVYHLVEEIDVKGGMDVS